MQSRRTFLLATVALAGSFILLHRLFAQNPDRFHFIHTDTQDSWPVLDPVLWSLEPAHEPVLARAAEGLSKLTPGDGSRIVRLVLRRCGLNHLEVHPGRIVGQALLPVLSRQDNVAKKTVGLALNWTGRSACPVAGEDPPQSPG